METKKSKTKVKNACAQNSTGLWDAQNYRVCPDRVLPEAQERVNGLEFQLTISKK